MIMTHTRLLVSDFKACFRFYRDAMGFPVKWGEEDGTYADFDANGHSLALFGKEPMAAAIKVESNQLKTKQQDDVCLVFAVDDVDGAYERMRGKRIPTIDQPHDRKDWGVRCFHLRDPEGILIEINKEIGTNGQNGAQPDAFNTG